MIPEYGSWKIIRKIGSGSFGTVYEIQREDFGYTYRAALKIISIPQNESEIDTIRSDGMDDESVTAYFESVAAEIVKEFELMYQLRGHTNIVSYEDHVVKPKNGGIGWDIMIRMELLTSLNNYVSQNKITRKHVIKLGIDLCNALERCQAYNVIHRDIKPANIFVSDQGDFKLGDFGIARTVEKTMSGLSKKGTYNYMAPEIYKGEPYGYSVDIYSLGLVMYRLVNNNRTPFLPPYPEAIQYKDHELALIKRMGGEQIPMPCQDDTQLAQIILKACSYNPGDRYSSPGEMRKELQALLDDHRENDIHEELESQETLSGGESHKYEDTIPLYDSGETDIKDASENADSNPKNDKHDGEPKSEEKKEMGGYEEPGIYDKPPGKTVSLKMIAAGALVLLLIIGLSKIVNYYNTTTVIPDVSGMEITNAKNLLEEHSLFCSAVQEEMSDEIPKGQVIRIEEEKKRIPKNSDVTLIVSQGTPKTVPNVVNQEKGNAIKQLEAIGLHVTVEPVYSDSCKEGMIAEQNISAGTTVFEGEEIVLKVSTGTKPFPLENYVGKKWDDVKTEMEKLGLLAEKKGVYSTEIAKNKVIKQSVEAGHEVKKNDTIIFTVSKGIEQITVPDIVGMSRSKAEAELKKAGFKIGSQHSAYSSSVDENVIMWQDETPGSKMDKGSYVSYRYSLGEEPMRQNSGNSSGNSGSSGGSHSAGGNGSSGNSKPTAVPKPKPTATPAPTPTAEDVEYINNDDAVNKN